MPKGFKGFQKGHKGFIPRERYKEIGKKISQSLTGKKLSLAHRKKLSIVKTGKKLPPFTEEHKRRIGLANKKKIHTKGPKHPSWKNGRTVSRGYIFIQASNHPANHNGYVREHRLVVEAQIGRYLKPEEIVHHLGKRSDNRPKMLMTFVNDNIHKRFHKNPDSVKSSEIIFDGRKLRY